MTLRLAAIAAALILLPGAAAAQSADNWSFAVGGGTDNRSKGVSKTQGEAFAYALAEWTTADERFYVSGQAQRVDASNGAQIEIETGAGFRPEVAGFDLNFYAAHKWNPDADAGFDDSAWEFTADVSRSIGPASGRLRVQYSPDAVGATESWTWVEGRAGWRFSPRLATSAAVGRREQENGVDYTAWNVGATYDLTDNVALDVRWYDTSERDRSATYQDALVAVVNLYF